MLPWNCLVTRYFVEKKKLYEQTWLDLIILQDSYTEIEVFSSNVVPKNTMFYGEAWWWEHDGCNPA